MEFETKKNRRLLPSLAASPFSFCGLATTSAIADTDCALGSHDAGTAATGDTNTAVVLNPAVVAARPLDH